MRRMAYVRNRNGSYDFAAVIVDFAGEIEDI